MTKKKDLNPDIMNEISEEEIRMSGIYDTHYYNVQLYREPQKEKL